MPQFLGEQDVYLFNEGTHHRMYEHLGAHIVGAGAHFGVWAPNARRVAVIGDFNDWTPEAGDLYPSESGIWRGHLAGAAKGHTYKYRLETAGNAVIEKADPYAFHGEVPPKSASVVWDLDYRWGDAGWMKQRAVARAPTSTGWLAATFASSASTADQLSARGP